MIGRPYLATMLDENQSLTTAWADFEADGCLETLDACAKAEAVPCNRTTLLVFSPYGFVAWIGALLPKGTAVPEGDDLNRIDLPGSRVAEITQQASMMLPLPLNQMMNLAFDKFTKAGIQIPEHLGQTDRPYFMERYELNDAHEIAAQTYTAYLGQDRDNGDETYLD